MRAGRLMLDIECRRSINNELVLKAFADVKDVRNAFVFTGQGSAHKMMGMKLYESSEHAKRVWNDADRHFVNRYGACNVFACFHFPTPSFRRHFDFVGGSKQSNRDCGALWWRQWSANSCTL